jgi:hypothetical protein
VRGGNEMPMPVPILASAGVNGVHSNKRTAADRKMNL